MRVSEIKQVGLLREVDGIPHLHGWHFEGSIDYGDNPTYESIVDGLRMCSGWNEKQFQEMNPLAKKHECEFCGRGLSRCG